MEPIFIYYNDLKFDKHKKFTINFSHGESLKGVVFRKNKDYYITSMTCYVDLTVNIIKLQKYDKIKEIHDLATVILRDRIDISYGKKVLTLAKASDANTTFRADKSRQSKYIESLEFFDTESKNKRNLHLFIIDVIERERYQILK